MKLSTKKQADAALQWHRIRLVESPVIRNGLVLLALAYFFVSLSSLEIEWTRVANGLPRAVKIITRMVPPDFGRWSLLTRGILESVQMALAASFLGMGLAVPLGICGAGNLVPKPVYLVARTIIILSRTFHEIIVAILFVKIFGFGPLAGVLTLTVGSTSFISKMIAEDIENMPAGQLEAIRATGADLSQTAHLLHLAAGAAALSGCLNLQTGRQYPPLYRGGDCWCRRYRSGTGRFFQPLRLRFQSGHPADHHRACFPR